MDIRHAFELGHLGPNRTFGKILQFLVMPDGSIVLKSGVKFTPHEAGGQMAYV